MTGLAQAVIAIYAIAIVFIVIRVGNRDGW
jgi:hypothetical protein